MSIAQARIADIIRDVACKELCDLNPEEDEAHATRCDVQRDRCYLGFVRLAEEIYRRVVEPMEKTKVRPRDAQELPVGEEHDDR
jgi:hypothetical protein